MKTRVFAPAKINLTLHVTGQRSDGYHLLDSLVVFAPFGDDLTMWAADRLSLVVDGPMARGVPAGEDNLVLRAARLLGGARGAGLRLTKLLPPASGIGGGSADAAAALRGLAALWGLAEPQAGPGGEARGIRGDILGLGADIPMCLASASCRVRGVGERLKLVTGLPPIPALVVNPGVGVSTPSVFKKLKDKDNAPMPETIPGFSSVHDLAGWLRDQRNDLETPAIAIQPAIDRVLKALRACPDILLARMSGSGATCFGIFPDRDRARAAHDVLARQHPDWWFAEGLLGDQSQKARPRPDAGSRISGGQV